MGLFNGAHHKNTVGLCNTLNFTEPVHKEIVVTLHVLGNDLQHEVEVSGDVITLNNFFELHDGFDELSGNFFVMLFQRNLAKDHDAFIYPPVIQ